MLEEKLDEILEKKYCLTDASIRSKCIAELFSIKGKVRDEKSLFQNVECKICQYVKTDSSSAVNHIYHVLMKLYLKTGCSYYEYMIKIICMIIYHNVCKARKICGGDYCIDYNEFQESFYELDLLKVLSEQNRCSKDNNTGIIWVLNTSVFLVLDYNINLLKLEMIDSI